MLGNLHEIASANTAIVQSPVLCTVRFSAGYSMGPGAKQQPAYYDVANVPADIQPLTFTDLQKLDGLNVQGTRRAIYLDGNVESIDRQAVKGGDLIVMPDLPNFPGPTTWLVNQVLEHWNNWCKVAATLQLPQ